MCCSVFTAKFINVCCLVKAQALTQVGFTLTFPPHTLYSLPVHSVGTQGWWVPLGDILAIIKQHQNLGIAFLWCLSESHPLYFLIFDFFVWIYLSSIYSKPDFSPNNNLSSVSVWCFAKIFKACIEDVFWLWGALLTLVQQHPSPYNNIASSLHQHYTNLIH